MSWFDRLITGTVKNDRLNLIVQNVLLYGALYFGFKILYLRSGLFMTFIEREPHTPLARFLYVANPYFELACLISFIYLRIRLRRASQ